MKLSIFLGFSKAMSSKLCLVKNTDSTKDSDCVYFCKW